MQNELMKIAEGFSIVAEAIMVITKDIDNGDKEEKAVAVKKQPESAKAKNAKSSEVDSGPAKDNAQKISIEDIRSVLAEKSQDGKSREVKALLSQYGVAKLSAVEEKDYPELLQKAKVL